MVQCLRKYEWVKLPRQYRNSDGTDPFVPIPENICSGYIDRLSPVWYTLDTMSRRNPSPDKYAMPYTCRSVLLAVMEAANEEFGRKKIKQRIRAGCIIRLLMRFFISDGWEWC